MTSDVEWAECLWLFNIYGSLADAMFLQIPICQSSDPCRRSSVLLLDATTMVPTNWNNGGVNSAMNTTATRGVDHVCALHNSNCFHFPQRNPFPAEKRKPASRKVWIQQINRKDVKSGKIWLPRSYDNLFCALERVQRQAAQTTVSKHRRKQWS